MTADRLRGLIDGHMEEHEPEQAALLRQSATLIENQRKDLRDRQSGYEHWRNQIVYLADRLKAAELHLFSGHGCDCRHMAEQRSAYLGTEKAYSANAATQMTPDAIPISGNANSALDLAKPYKVTDLNSEKQE